MPKKILIVEDQFIVAFDLQLILEARGYSIVGIAHDAAGLTALSKITGRTWCAWIYSCAGAKPA